MNKKISIWIIVTVLLVSNIVYAISIEEGRTFIIGDAVVGRNSPNENDGSGNTLSANSFSTGSNDFSTYYLINVSNKSIGSPYSNITINFNIFNIANAHASQNISFWYGNTTFNETNITGNNQVCGTDWNTAQSPCNSTIFYSMPTTSISTGNFSFNITDKVNNELQNDDGVFTLLIRQVKASFDATNREVQWNSRETTGLGAYLQFGASNPDVFLVTAKNRYTGGSISNYNIVVYNSTYTNSSNVTTGTASFSNLGGEMTFNITATNFVSNSTVINTSVISSHQFSLFSTNSVNLSIYDETLGSSSNFFNGKEVLIEIISDDFAQNYSTNTGNFYVDLLSPSEYRISTTSAGYKKRDYYFTLTNQTNNFIDLYLLSLSNSTDVTFTVLDQSGTSIQDALIKLKRGYILSDQTYSYQTVAMAKTDVNGEAIIDVDFDDAFYQTFVSKNTSSINTDGAKIFSTTVTITLNTLADSFSSIDTLEDVSGNITFNNESQTFSFIFDNAVGTNVIGTLNVYKKSTTGSSLECTDSVTSSSSTLLCVVNTTSNEGTYYAEGLVDPLTGVGNVIKDTKEVFTGITKQTKDILGNQGVFLSILVAGTLGGLGATNPAIAIIMFLSGLMGMVYFGFSAITIGMSVLFFAIGGFVIYKIRT